MNAQTEQLLEYAQMFEDTIYDLHPILLARGEASAPLRKKIEQRLLGQIICLAMSALKLTKIQTALSAKAIDENHQAILALLRVLTESCNKLYYLSIEPKDELELSLRWTNFLLVGRVNINEF